MDSPISSLHFPTPSPVDPKRDLNSSFGSQNTNTPSSRRLEEAALDTCGMPLVDTCGMPLPKGKTRVCPDTEDQKETRKRKKEMDEALKVAAEDSPLQDGAVGEDSARPMVSTDDDL